MVDSRHGRLSITRQCRLVSIARSSYYYEGRGESPLNLRLMRLIDEQFLETPFYGSRQMTRWLRIHPNLLRDLAITRPNQVWCSDVTYAGAELLRRSLGGGTRARPTSNPCVETPETTT